MAISSAIGLLPRNETLKRGVYSLGLKDRLQRYQYVFSLVPGETVDGLFRDGLLPQEAGDRVLDYWSDLFPQMQQLDELGGLQLLELRSSLPDELLMYADKLSMAHSLEVRVPYLDRTIVEYVQRLRANFKVRNATGKWLHRLLCQKFLPHKILARKKRGFAVNVVDSWFDSSLNGTFNSILMDESSLIFRVLSPKAVGRLLQEHQLHSADNHKLLFSLVVLEEWMRLQEVP
jgi:asparagine synthase (glutamine-hydrolysing)